MTGGPALTQVTGEFLMGPQSKNNNKPHLLSQNSLRAALLRDALYGADNAGAYATDLEGALGGAPVPGRPGCSAYQYPERTAEGSGKPRIRDGAGAARLETVGALARLPLGLQEAGVGGGDCSTGRVASDPATLLVGPAGRKLPEAAEGRSCHEGTAEH